MTKSVKRTIEALGCCFRNFSRPFHGLQTNPLDSPRSELLGYSFVRGADFV